MFKDREDGSILQLSLSNLNICDIFEWLIHTFPSDEIQHLHFSLRSDAKDGFIQLYFFTNA